MEGVLTRSGGRFARLFDWWIGELAALVPAWLRRALAGVERAVIFDIDDDGVTIRETVDDKVREVGRVALADIDPAAERAAIADCLGRLNPKRRLCGLRLHDDRILRDTIEMPAAVEGNLRRIIGFQLDRHTPFKPEEVFYDCRVAWRKPALDTIGVEFIVAPRKVISDAIERARGWGVEPAMVTFGGDDPVPARSLNLLWPTETSADRRGIRVLNAVLAGVAALLVAVAAYLPVERARLNAEDLRVRADHMRTEAHLAARLKVEFEAAVKQRDFIIDKKRNTVPATRILQQLTRVMPDDTWVFKLRLKGTEVQVGGFAPSAPSLIATIEKSPYFSAVQPISSVTRDRRSGQQRFNLSFQTNQAAFR